MLSKRIIPCLDMDQGRVVKGVKFRDIRDAGDPLSLAEKYYKDGADELIFLDIGATYQSRDILIQVVERISSKIFIPLTVGGGLRTIEDMRKVLRTGADKISLCTAALKNPRLISEGAEAFGSQCIVLSVDAKREGDHWTAYSHGGRNSSGRDALEWIQEGESLGAGEILLNSIDRDGTQQGYDLELLHRAVELTSIPVIASGGGGNESQMLEALQKGRADALLLASVLHDEKLQIAEIKTYLKKKGVTIR